MPQAQKKGGGSEAASTSAAALTSANASIAQEKQARKADARRSRQKRKDYAKQLTKTGREPIEFGTLGRFRRSGTDRKSVV